MDNVRHLSIFIPRSPSDVYAFASDPRNLPQWAAGLTTAEIRQEGDAWIATAPFGNVTIRFAPPNDLGVMDHDVELESGAVFHNPMRVMPHGDGSEFLFTLFRQPGMIDADFERDAAAIQQDLTTLKALLERGT